MKNTLGARLYLGRNQIRTISIRPPIQSNRVKVSQTDPVGQSAGQFICKCLKMNDLQNNRLSVRSNPVKLNQRNVHCFLVAIAATFGYQIILL
jgi:hypothetical protein